MPKRDERVPAIVPMTPTERRLSRVQRRLTTSQRNAREALAERDALLVALNEDGETHKHLAGVLTHGHREGGGDDDLTIACVGRAVRRTRPDDAVDGRTRRYLD